MRTSHDLNRIFLLPGLLSLACFGIFACANSPASNTTPNGTTQDLVDEMDGADPYPSDSETDLSPSDLTAFDFDPDGDASDSEEGARIDTEDRDESDVDALADADIADGCPEGEIPNDTGDGCIPLEQWEVRVLPEEEWVDFIPGETAFDTTERFETWTIEWVSPEADSTEGLDFDAYDSVIRPPYIQDVTPTSAVILWRVNASLPLDELTAWVQMAPADTALGEGTLFTVNAGIEVAYAMHTYQYESGVTLDNPMVEHGESDYWLNGLTDRPIIEFRATLADLVPDTIYHYRVVSDSFDPSSGVGPTVPITLADDVYFRTAPVETGTEPFRFLAMGDFGPGDDRPSYFYDVFDLFHHAARRYGPSLWLGLGDIDNDTDGHPNAMDPFFFNLYNAYHDHDFFDDDHPTSNLVGHAAMTSVEAFRHPPYYGLLGGLPVFPIFGNHDICTENDSSLAYWTKAYRGNFVLPDSSIAGFGADFSAAAQTFNSSSDGFYYTFRYGNVIFICLGIPRSECDLGNGSSWWSQWGAEQLIRLEAYLTALREEIQQETVWVIVCLHDYNWLDREPLRSLALSGGVDVMIAGHDHDFYDMTVSDGEHDYHAIVVGTGGFGDTDEGDQCHRPGFILVEVENNLFEYWKFDTHQFDLDGVPLGRESLQPTIREYRKIRREGFGRHRIFMDGGSDRYLFGD